MNETEFGKFLIDVINHDDHPEKTLILNLLRGVTIRFDKTSIFTKNLWNHYQEYIHLCVSPDKIIPLKRYISYLYKVCGDIYEPNDTYEFFGIELKPCFSTSNEDVSQEILFENIRQEIVQEIREAKYIIWVAMAWFTDPMLFHELLEKSKQGVNIQIVIDDNDRNRNAGFKLSENFETYWVSIQSLYKNVMHDKFCIIDLRTVIHGTYNWTLAAQFNKETISIDKNRETAERFADEFIKLKRNEEIQ